MKAVIRRKQLDKKEEKEGLTQQEAKEYIAIQRKYGVLNPVRPNRKTK